MGGCALSSSRAEWGGKVVALWTNVGTRRARGKRHERIHWPTDRHEKEKQNRGNESSKVKKRRRARMRQGRLRLGRTHGRRPIPRRRRRGRVGKRSRHWWLVTNGSYNIYIYFSSFYLANLYLNRARNEERVERKEKKRILLTQQ